jgi:DNA-binding IscR family transcriptional regulator
MSEHPDHCEGHCILQEVWVGVDEESRRVLEHVTLAQLVERTRVGHRDRASS